MTSLYEILKASKGVPVDDMYTALLGRAVGGGSDASEIEYTGSVPVSIKADGSPIIAYRISGNLVQTGTPSPSSIITPQETGERTINLCPENWELGQYRDGVWEVVPNRRTSEYIPITAQIYRLTINAEQDISFININLFDENKTWVGNRVTIGMDAFSPTAQNILTPVLPSNAKYIRLVVRPYNEASYTLDTQTVINSKVMLSAGSSLPSFEPYGYKLAIESGGVTTPVYLSEPLRKIGEYADKVEGDTVTRYIKKLVLTGEETWYIYSVPNIQQFHTSGAQLMCLPASSFYSNITPYGMTPSTRSSYTFGCCGATAGDEVLFQMYGARDTFTDAAAWKAYLAAQYAAGTPVTIWYILATPTTETITAPTIPTVAGTQTFDINTTLKPSEVYIKYKGKA